ncbi:MAG: S41 family peptidase [Candidatus Bruticola sp.]
MSEKALKALKIVAILAAIVLISVLFNYVSGGSGIFNLGDSPTSAPQESRRGMNAPESASVAPIDEQKQIKNEKQNNSAGFTVKTQTFEEGENVEFIWDEGHTPENNTTGKGSSEDTVSKVDSEEIPDNWVLAEDQSEDSEVAAAVAPKAVASVAHTPAKKNFAEKSATKKTAALPKAKASSAAKDSDEPLNNKMSDFELDIDYKSLLKNPSELGFTPTKELFANAYYRIRTSFVQVVNDEQLEKGVVKEVSKLVKSAGLSAEGLNKLDKNKNVLTQILNLYDTKINKDLLTYSAIEGMLYGLGDPYSILMTPKEYSSLKEQVQTQGFGGIGIYIEADKDDSNQVTVFEPMEGAPAYKAGIEPGDKILAINGTSTKGLALDVATKMIRGPVGSTVVLKIKRPGTDKILNISVVRANIHVVSCTSKMYGKIGYIRMRQFGADTAQELAAELNKVRAQGASGLILDLRNNGGGFVQAAVGVGSQFIRRGGLIVYTLDRAGSRSNLNSEGDGKVDMPMIVMINRFSASASEITAGAMRDHKLAKLLGERSFGKGSVQQIFPFDDGSAMKMTVARFYSPSGHVIDHNGLTPDITVKMEPRFVGKKDKDIQLQKALQILSAR